MKVFACLLPLIIFFHYEKMNKVDPFSIDLWDYDYSLSYTTHYKITNDSIGITIISSLENEQNCQILLRSLNKNERYGLEKFLSDFPLEKFDSTYRNPNVADGDQKRIIIILRGITKTIDIENVYQADIANLINCINNFLEKKTQIYYPPAIRSVR